MKALSLLGSTGSIGAQTLDVVRGLNAAGAEPCTVAVLAAHSNVPLLERQAREFRPQAVTLFDPAAAKDFQDRTRDLSIPVFSGIEGLCRAAAWETADIVLNAVVGMVGLRPTLAALGAKKPVALANKETLVAGGEVKRLLLTASGGPFLGKAREELANVTPEMALRHPNWSMGAKVTIDSATMMNKGLEVMEARWLFDLPVEKIQVVVHRESIVHSMVEYADNGVIAQLGAPDMRLPIQYALTYPNRLPCPAPELDLFQVGSLSFSPPDTEAFPCLSIAVEALRRGGLAPAAVNAANEQAVAAFLQGRIGFLEIPELAAGAAARQPDCSGADSLDAVLEADRAARQYVETQLNGR